MVVPVLMTNPASSRCSAGSAASPPDEEGPFATDEAQGDLRQEIGRLGVHSVE